MTPEEFVEWIENLELQTLTYELKEEIISNYINIDHGTSNATR